ncbi:MAG: LuxR C-terminal-related transcriptional regulator [Nitrospiraceae bacterium]|nr:LuxR C-terminal-related transcriptional regulator [Nitrospiraceae bacterium]
MQGFKKSEIGNLLDFLREVYALRNLDEFGTGLIRALPRLFSCDIYSYNEVNPERQRLSVVMDPDIIPAANLRIFEKYMNQHPLINHYRQTGDGRALKISDFLGRRRFHRLDLYNEYYRVHKIESQLAVVMPAPAPLVVGVVLNRSGHDFSERERLRLEILRPHLAAAYRNAEVFTALRESPVCGRKVVVFEIKGGRASMIAGEAGQWLAEYFGRPVRPDEKGLPEDLVQWIKEEEISRAGTGRPPCAPQALTLRSKRGFLAVRLLPGAPSVLVMEEKRTGGRPEELTALGLTGKEAEILKWLNLGKTNREIAAIAGISHRTVKKHLEHIYAKLGVKTRTAAAGMANRHPYG